MTNDRVAIWNNGLKFGRAPVNGELLVGDGSSFVLATLTAGANISVVNTPGGIEIGATGLTTGTVTSVGLTSTGTGFTVSGSPVTSSGTINLAGTLNPTHGGTGLSDPTANSLLVANGASNMTLVAPGASGNVLTSNGTTWSSAAPPPTSWTLVKKTADQSPTTVKSTYTDDSELTFSVVSGGTYTFACTYFISPGAGGYSITQSGPTLSASFVSLGYNQSGISTFPYETGAATTNITSITLVGTVTASASGSITMKISKFQASAAATVFRAGSFLNWARIA
jgi:hypothetical protein